MVGLDKVPRTAAQRILKVDAGEVEFEVPRSRSRRDRHVARRHQTQSASQSAADCAEHVGAALADCGAGDGRYYCVQRHQGSSS